MYLTKVGLTIEFPAIQKDWLKKYKKKFMLYNKTFDGKTVCTQTYLTDRKNNTIIVPRMIGLMTFGGLTNPETGNSLLKLHNKLSKGVDIPKRRQMVKGLELMLNQALTRDYLMTHNYEAKWIRVGLGSAIIDLEPGQGKTYIAMSLIPEWWKKTLIVVPNTKLLEQWVEALEQYFPNLTIGYYYGAKKKNGDVIVGVINSLVVNESFFKMPASEWFDTFGLVIYDEIHMYCAKKRSKIFRKAQAMVTLGMSGTCHERLDKLDPIAHQHIGIPIDIKKLKGYLDPNKTIGWKTQVQVMKYKGHPRYIKKICGVKGWVQFASMITQFCLDPFRTQLIIGKAMEYYKDGRNIFIFVDRRRFVELYTQLFRSILSDDEVEAPELDANFVMGGVTKNRKNDAKTKGRICCVTYDAAGTGLSFDRYDTVIYATPRKSGYKQYINRIYRLGGNSKVMRIICDVVDYSTSIKSQHYFRKKVYLAEKCPSKEDMKDPENKAEFEIVAKIVHWKDYPLCEAIKSVYNDPVILKDLRDTLKKYIGDISIFHEDIEDGKKEMSDLDKINNMLDKMFANQSVSVEELENDEDGDGDEVIYAEPDGVDINEAGFTEKPLQIEEGSDFDLDDHDIGEEPDQ